MKNGDLIFLMADGSPVSEAIAASSAPVERLDHVGVIRISDGEPTVIEARWQIGVVETPLDEFLARAPQPERYAGWMLRRLDVTDGVDIGKAVERAAGHIGEAYNSRFIPTPGALYCSELVQRCYLTDDGLSFFRSIPMDFSGGMDYWRLHFAALGMDVPQNREGTSPLSIYRQTVEAL